MRRLLRSWSPDRRPTARQAPSGRRSTPAWSPAAALDGQEVVTAEGLGTPDDLHPVQHEMAVRGGSQCGYCTPGFVCSMAAEFYRADRTSSASTNGTRAADDHGENGFDLHALSGNLCRCTGYRPIRDAAYALGPARGRRPSRRTPEHSGARTRAGPARRRGATFVRPRDLAEALRPARPTATPSGRRQPPTGASRSTCAASRPRAAGGGRPAGRAARPPVVERRAADRGRPDASPRSSDGWTVGCRCSTSSSGSSRPG